MTEECVIAGPGLAEMNAFFVIASKEALPRRQYGSGSQPKLAQAA
jgi:hypothetical protein